MLGWGWSPDARSRRLRRGRRPRGPDRKGFKCFGVKSPLSPPPSPVPHLTAAQAAVGDPRRWGFLSHRHTGHRRGRVQDFSVASGASRPGLWTPLPGLRAGGSWDCAERVGGGAVRAACRWARWSRSAAAVVLPGREPSSPGAFAVWFSATPVFRTPPVTLFPRVPNLPRRQRPVSSPGLQTRQQADSDA